MMQVRVPCAVLLGEEGRGRARGRSYRGEIGKRTSAEIEMRKSASETARRE